MSDYLLELGANPQARKVIKRLGLPVPMPQQLRRAAAGWEELPLQDFTIAVGGAPGAQLVSTIAVTLAAAGADPEVTADELAPVFREPGEAYGRPARRLDLGALPADLRADGLVFDASGVTEPAGLRALYDFFHPLVGRLAPSGRAVILGRPADTCARPATAAAQAALEGFMRSLGKEIGKRGATASLITVEPDAEGRLGGVLRFLLSPHSAFVSGQPLRVSAAARATANGGWVRTLEHKVALVTGAARGIGEATARLLAREGAHVVCLDRPADDAPLSRVAREIRGSVLLADLGDPGAPAVIARALTEAHGGVDVVVHNAGITRDRTLANLKPEGWDQAIDVNLAAVVRVTDALLEGGVLHDGGRVVCLSSVAGIAGNVGQTNYAASKAGLIGFVRREAAALAERGITVNAVAPGFIETRLTAAIPFMIREVGRRLSSLGQGGLPRDVAEVITFLATPAAVGLTGSVVRVCGGAFIGA
jgi:3-oxoacyl-[acyl-carrier protein] reductase